ncbi:MAG: terpene cyclase/mutase family protein [Planctomycetaceae bacterium]|nr:terpene cyclase/mutase family protein [Planctomycetaceae bacterium]
MKDSNTNESQDGMSREAFARQVREQAEHAASMSVHYARLSQHYMELSNRYSNLAEQASSAELNSLQSQLHELARRATKTASVIDAAGSAAPELSLDTAATAPDSPARKANLATSAPDEDFDSLLVHHQTFRPTDSTATFRETSATTAVPSESEKPASLRQLTTRRFVQRVRAARLIRTPKVRVKAKKADLQPRVRTATDEIRKGSGSYATSLMLLLLAIVGMNLITWQTEIQIPLDPIVASFASEKPPEEPQPVEPPAEEAGEQTEQPTEPEPVPEPEPEEVPPEPDPKEAPPESPAPMPDQPPPEESQPAEPLPSSEMVADTNTTETSEAASTQPTNADSAANGDHRGEGARQALLKKFGGSQASEECVQRALEWLISVQHPQGWWDFTQTGPAGQAGTINNPIGGTAYALLPFLAAGHTHTSGNFQKQIGNALTYLTKIGINVPAGYDLRGMVNKQSDDKEPNEAYYVHGAATLALCEAYGMTKDRRLKRACEGAVKFLVNSQDPRGGGWRYSPQEAGSTSVTVIQVMALTAAKKAGLDVPDVVFQRVHTYLDSVQVDGEGRYGYELQKKTYKGSVTAMALLCRMYLGWGREGGDLQAGVALLDKAGPYDNLYTTYFATQVMKNWGGDEWQRWNERVRDDLIACQETEGPAKGSWKPRTGAIHAKQGGRLLTTVLATLTLEVYYRYQPLLPEVAASAKIGAP